jgi:hypothetical protein
MKTLLISLASVVVGGVLGWFIGFVGDPITRFFNIREKIRDRMRFYDDVGPSERDGGYKDTQQTLRGLSTELEALSVNHPWALWIIKLLFGYRPAEAADSLLGFSSTLIVADGSKAK